MTYQQHDRHSRCFNSLDSDFKASKKLVASNATAKRISYSMVYEVHAYSYIIKFSNAIMFDKARNKVEQ